MTIDLAADASVFLADFGESITYTPYGGTPVTRTMLVLRGKTQPLTGPQSARQASRREIYIEVANSSTTGVLASAVKWGQDTISVPEYPGGSGVTYVVSEKGHGDGVEWVDAGFWRATCVK